MGKQHVGALAAAIVGFALGRVLGHDIAGAVGALTGHGRHADTAVGAALVAVPFLALAGFTVLRLAAPALLGLPAVRAALAAGWLVAGLVMGLLPWSRAGAETGLRTSEAHRAPGLLHGMDLALLAGVVLTVGLLLLALRARPATGGGEPVADWLERSLDGDPPFGGPRP